jgi:hypothetical protein
MKRGGIVLGIVVLVGIVALLGSVQFGYGKEKPGAVLKKAGPRPCPEVATWKIVKIAAQPACYTPPPPCTHTPRDRDFIHSMTAVLEAGPTSLPPGGIVLDGSAWDCALAAAKALSPLDLTGVPVGGSVTLTWGGTTVVVKRPDSHHIHLYLPECHIGCGCAGGPTITSTITAHTMNCGREVKKHTRIHKYLPCP